MVKAFRKPAFCVTSSSRRSTRSWLPSKSWRNEAWVPVVPLQPRNLVRRVSFACSRFCKSLFSCQPHYDCSIGRKVYHEEICYVKCYSLACEYISAYSQQYLHQHVPKVVSCAGCPVQMSTSFHPLIRKECIP